MNQTARKINTAELVILRLSVSDEKITAEINDGRIVSIPISWFPRLNMATVQQRNIFEISSSGYGVHWPELDEDISIKSFIS